MPPPVPAARRSDAPGIFRHPQADREIRLADERVAYALRRSRRSSIGFVVGPEGLRVNAPKWIGVGAIEGALREKAAWIVRKLHEQAERGLRLQASRIDWRDGTTLPVLGREVTLVIDPCAVGVSLPGLSDVVDGWPAGSTPGQVPADLRVGLPHGATPAQIRRAVQIWLQHRARQVFAARCAHFAPLLGVRPTRLGLSSAATRWGSASANGQVRFNWRLIHLAPACIDYVVVHELAHLREMNHSSRFWAVVRSVLPDYAQPRAALKDALSPLLD